MDFEPLRPHWADARPSYWLGLATETPRDQLFARLELPAAGAVLSDDAAMFLACAMSLRGAGNVSPNPMVGAVLLDARGRYLSSGAHLRVGESHAEVNAMNAAPPDSQLDGASLFVTLEPCSHQGRTPSCAETLALTGIRRVVYGLGDPNPLVNGAGVARLRRAGKKVELAVGWQSVCEWLARVFIYNQKFGAVYVGMKVASSPSGVIAGQETRRLWITGERARQMGRYLRLEYDAICVGARTAMLDDPVLDVRHPCISGRMPLRIVVDGEGILLREPKRLKMFKESQERTVLFLPNHSDEAKADHFGVKVCRLRCADSSLFSWADINRELWALGIRSVLLEGGAGVYKSAMQESAVQALHWFVAPDDRLEGIKWSVNSEALEIYKKGGGVPLGEDRLVELSF